MISSPSADDDRVFLPESGVAIFPRFCKVKGDDEEVDEDEEEDEEEEVEEVEEFGAVDE